MLCFVVAKLRLHLAGGGGGLRVTCNFKVAMVIIALDAKWLQNNTAKATSLPFVLPFHLPFFLQLFLSKKLQHTKVEISLMLR